MFIKIHSALLNSEYIRKISLKPVKEKDSKKVSVCVLWISHETDPKLWNSENFEFADLDTAKEVIANLEKILCESK